MRKRVLGALVASVLAALSISAAPASAAVGLTDFDATFTNKDGSPALQAGSHPYEARVVFGVNTKEGPEGGTVVDEPVKNLIAHQPVGFIGSQTAVPRCSTTDFLVKIEGRSATNCADSTAVGHITIQVGEKNGVETFESPLYNLAPAPGKVAKLAFWAFVVPVTIDIGLSEDPPYHLVATPTGISQVLEFFHSDLILWGNPADPAHDEERGYCFAFGGSCPAGVPSKAFLTAPRACEGPLESVWEVESWTNPGTWVKGSAFTHDDAIPPNPRGFSGCGLVGFSPTIEAQPTTLSSETGTGLDFNLDIDDEGLANPDGIAESDLKEAVVTLPEGITINPSAAEGLEVCTPTQLDRESSVSIPGQGCPSASKLGTVGVETPLLEGSLAGSVFLAQQDDAATPTPGAENPFDTLLAFYIVIQDRQLGVSIKLPAKVEPDPKTGQLITTVQNAPQLPFSHFNLHFREGARAPLISPPACGTYEAKAKLTPWANPSSPLTTSASFQINTGIGAGPCPPGGVPSFKPHFEAGSLNNNAGSFSPFNMRLIRNDGEQDMTKFSSVLPPGELGSLKGVSKCPDAAIEVARSKTGRQELASPSCPANSLIGHTLAGAGVGGTLTYVGGQIYLGGPYKGDPLSVISVTPAVAGPFDAGTVVVRLALDLNPETAEVEVDGASSDPIPHILEGIVLKVRDLRVYVDRPNFTLNPTSCDPSAAKATLFGSYLDVFSPADDVPVDLSTRYQAANCLNLGFKPNLKLNLRGGSKRGGHPGLKAVLTPRPGDANIAAAKVTLPRSAFLEQGHIRTICTRVQFAAEQCPPGSIYGHAKAITPLLDEPVEGPVILRSSSNKLPDLVLALKGLVDVNVSSRIDSFKGGIRNTFEVVPDAPVSKFTLTLQGGKKGLIVNSKDLCKGKTSRVTALFSGQNGKAITLRPKLQPQCGGSGRGAKRSSP